MPFKIKKTRKRFSVSERLLAPVRRLAFYKKYSGKFKNFEEAVFVCLAAFCIGLFAGILTGHSWSFKPAGNTVSSGGPGFFQKTFGSVISVPGVQPDGSFIFSGFEAASDFGAWKLSGSEMELSAAHSVEGEHSAKVHFYGKSTLSGIRIEKYFNSRYALTDWSGFRAVRFFIYNPEDKPFKFIFQLEDNRGKHFKRNLTVAPKQGVDFEFSLEEVGKVVNPRKIRQINLFLWKSPDDHEIYLDHVRLAV